MQNNKYGILTFHRALNYGAILQTYALQRTLEKYNVNVEIIDYRAEFNEKRFEKKKISSLLKPRELYYILFRNGYNINNRLPFELFTKKFLKLSKQKYYTPIELEKGCEEYDKIICGSDQIWNLACTDNDNSYFLPFDLKSTKKISYAASFGVEMIPAKDNAKCIEYLSDFKAISVREKSGTKIVKKLLNKNIPDVLDPTLLLTFEEWKTIGDNSILPSKKYVLVYLMSEDKVLMNLAREIAKKKKLLVLYINDRLFKAKGMNNLASITPSQYIALFDNASYVVTNSFHGTVFSINFNKNFYVKYIPRSIANTRLENILTDLQLMERLVGVNGEYAEHDINYTITNKLLNDQRDKSMSYIKNSIIASQDE